MKKMNTSANAPTKAFTKTSSLASAITLALASSTAFVGFTATAETLDSQMNHSNMETIVVTAAGHAQDVATAPASISVISREDLENRYYRDVTDALRKVPGVVVTGGGDNTDISMRGMGSKYSLILVDGKRQSSRETRPNSDGPGIEQGWLPPIEAIERIEVIRGPMSTLYGSDAIGGVINIITRKGHDEWSGNVQIGQTIQEDRKSGNEQSANFYLSGPASEKVSLKLSGQTTVRDEDEITNGYEDKSLQSLNAGVIYQINDDHQVEFDAGISKQSRSGTVGNSVPTTGCRGGCEDTENNYDRNYYGISYQGDLGKLGTAEIYVQHEENENHSRLIYNDNTTFKSTLVTPLGDHTLLSGFEYQTAKLEDYGTNTASDLSELSNNRYAFFLEDEWMLTDDFALTLGARLDDDETYGTHVSPRAYGVWSIDDNWILKGGISTGYRAPSLRETSPNWAQISGGGDIYGNPDLKPETSLNTELSLNYQSDWGLNSSVTLFNNDFKDKVTRIRCVSCGPINQYGSTATTRVNVDEAVTRGVEVAFDMPISDDWYVSASYTFTDSEQKTGEYKGDPLEQLPEHLFSADLSWQATADLEAWTSLTYHGAEMKPAGYYASTSATAPSYTFVDVGVSYALTDDVSVNGAIYNLFDDEVGYDEYGYVEDGRRYWVSLNVGF